jgi:hypothetical protein
VIQTCSKLAERKGQSSSVLHSNPFHLICTHGRNYFTPLVPLPPTLQAGISSAKTIRNLTAMNKIKRMPIWQGGVAYRLDVLRHLTARTAPSRVEVNDERHLPLPPHQLLYLLGRHLLLQSQMAKSTTQARTHRTSERGEARQERTALLRTTR